MVEKASTGLESTHTSPSSSSDVLLAPARNKSACFRACSPSLHLEPHVLFNRGPAAAPACEDGTWPLGVLGVDSVSSSEIAEYLKDIHGPTTSAPNENLGEFPAWPAAGDLPTGKHAGQSEQPFPHAATHAEQGQTELSMLHRKEARQTAESQVSSPFTRQAKRRSLQKARRGSQALRNADLHAASAEQEEADAMTVPLMPTLPKRSSRRRGLAKQHEAVPPMPADRVLTEEHLQPLPPSSPFALEKDSADRSSVADKNLAAHGNQKASVAQDADDETPSSFGKIMSGVLMVAKSSEQASVFRIEEAHRQARSLREYKGISRIPWTVQWKATIPREAGEEEKEVGVFHDPEVAAKARDVALLRVHGNSIKPEELNFPNSYDESALAACQDIPVSAFIEGLSQHGVQTARRSSRFRGVRKLTRNSFEAQYELKDEDIEG